MLLLLAQLESYLKDNGGVTVGLCANCVHARIVRSDRGSIFYRCGLSDTDPAFPKYPRLPVLNCAGYEIIETRSPP
jgi:hypothetical protein